MLGFDEHDPKISPDWRRLVHPDDMGRVQTMIREHIAGKSPMFESVHRMRHCNGEWRWVVSRAKARADSSGRLKRLVGVEFDITERKLYEDALFREKESAQITLQSIGDGVITTDAHLNVEYLNPVAEELTGWHLNDAQGRSIDDIFRGFHEETCEPLENPLSVAIRRSRAIKSVRPTLLIKRDGHEMYVESTASPIRDGLRSVLGRRARLSRREREPRAQSQALLPREPRHPHGARQPPRVRGQARAVAAQRPRSRDLIRALSTSTSTSSRSSTIPAVTARAMRSSARSARCSRPRSAGATRSRGSVAMNTQSCSRAARSTRPCAWPSSSATLSAITSSSGRSAHSGWAAASA
jgi:PAS domain S-box-containing protein